MPKILLFASGLMGELTLKKLEADGIDVLVATNPPESMRRKPTGSIFSLSHKFKIFETTAPRYHYSANTLPKADIAVTIDWAKDFFHDSELPYPVYHSHPSLLPLYRGYGAISEQFLRGVKVSGITFYEEQGKVDAGDILYQETIPLEYGKPPATFISKCADVCATFIGDITNGKRFTKIQQNELKSFYLTRTRQRQTLIDFNASAYAVYNFIMAYSYPFSGALFYYDGNKFSAMIALVEKWNGTYGNPGEIISITDNGIEIACGEGSIIIKEVKTDNKIIPSYKFNKYFKESSFID